MRSLLVAAALSLGLLAVGTTADTAAAAPFPDRSLTSFAQEVTPVHYQRGYGRGGYYQRHYAPPARHDWHRYAPPPHHSWRHARRYQYGSRY
jgi:hypothetical protein